ncbi:MAG: hypothetical protein L0Y54_23670, partial [Sporichthyaceae bacterium]|nr:hypothetical protein [Sporichthyaceae bacterium]
MDQPMLTAPHVFFHSVGYLRVPGLLGLNQVERLRDTAFRVAADGDQPHVRHTPEKTRLDQVVSLDATYLEIASADPVLDTLMPVLGPNIELVENRHNHLSIYRSPGTDRLHRDILQWSRSILT